MGTVEHYRAVYRDMPEQWLGTLLERNVEIRRGEKTLILISPEKADAQYRAAMDELHERALQHIERVQRFVATQERWAAAEEARIDARLAEEISEEDVRQAVGPDLPVSTVWALLRKAYELGQTNAWNGGDY
jgi:TPP-dependent pyruvate/acetoin dehydrogenase alpha subunit